MKKITAMLTAVVMTVTAFSQMAFAAFTDVTDDNPYKDAISTLSTLSVIDGYVDGTFKPDGAITRAEFTKLIVFMLNLQDVTYQSYSFPDVEPSFWASNFIQTAYDRNIIVGFEDGTFHPQDQVTYAQVLKMVVCTLGYEDHANALTVGTDGWADKYIQEANQLGLSKGVGVTEAYGPASRGIVAQVLYNALEIKMNENNGYNWISSEKTLMNDYLKVKKLKGTLVGIGDYLTDDCTISLPEDNMDIMDNDGKEYLIDYSSYTTQVTDISKYLGINITVYYRQLSDSDERKLVSIDIDSGKSSTLEISYDDLASLSGNTLKYYDPQTSKSKTIKLKDDITVRYNGKLVPADNNVSFDGESFTRSEMLEKWLTDKSGYTIYGTVTLTDSGSDGTYDMIQIYDYETIVALSAPTSTDYRITDKLVTGNALILDPQAANYTYTITKDGKEIPITSVAANDVLLYAWSLDGETCTVIDTAKTVSGQITSISSNKDTMTISNNTYNVGPLCEKYILEKNNKELKTGVSGTFYLDAFNTAVYGTIQETTAIPYGYIVNTFMEDGKPWITVYAPSISAGEASSYPLKKNVKVNGVSLKSDPAYSRIETAASYTDLDTEVALADKIYGAGKAPENASGAMPARIKVENGEVSEVVILSTDELYDQNEDKEQIVQGRALDEYTYNNNSFSLGGKTSFSVNSSTTVIVVPMDRNKKKGYAKKTPSTAFTSGEKYFIDAYDLNSSKIAGLIVLYGSDGTLTKVKKDTDFSVVAKEPEQVYNTVKDDTVLSLDLFTGASNTIKKWNTFDKNEFADVEVGDVIQFAYDSDNLIQGRIDNIDFSNVKQVLDGELMNKNQLYNWDVEVDPDTHNGQTMMFDYRFKKPGTSDDEMYQSSTLGFVPNSRAVIFNVSQVLTDEKKLYVTKNGFDDSNGEGEYVLDDSDYEEIDVTASTKILRMEPERDEISPYAADTTTNLTINDLKDAKNYGTGCSKILVLMAKGSAKLILIYN